MNYNETKSINGQFYKLATVLGFIMVMVAVICVWNSPTIGYESSIYISTPLIFWILIFISFSLGVGIVISKIGEKDTDDKSWMLGLLLIWIISIVIMALPTIRGYFFLDGAGDTGEHLGWTQDLLASGHTADYIFYPITHIIFVQLSLVLGIEPISIFRWVMLLFAGLSFVSIYLVCKELLSIKRQMAIATVAGSILLQIWSTFLTPNAVGNILLPFFIFILIKVNKTTTQSFQWTLLLIVLVIFIVPLHPIPALAFMLICIAMWLWSLFKSRHRSSNISQFKTIGSPLVLLIIVWFFVWLSSFGTWEATLRSVYSLLTEGGQTHLQSLSDQTLYAAQYGYNVIVQFIKLYGHILVYVFLAALGFIILQRRSLQNYYSYQLAPFAWAIVMLGFVMLTFYFFNIIFDPDRLEAYVKLLCPPFVGIALGSFIVSKKWLGRSQRVRSLYVGLLLVLISVGAVLILYPSPYILSVNYQTTLTEINGMDWFLHNKDIRITSTGWYYAPWVYERYLLTSEQRIGRNDLNIYVTKPFPNRFGYDKNEELGQSYEEDVYLVMTELTRKVYEDVYPKMASLRLSIDDLNKLEEDQSVDRIYANEGIELYYVHAK